MTRSQAREIAMKILYQMDIQKDFNTESIKDYLISMEIKGKEAFLNNLLTKTCENIEVIDQDISSNSQGWSLNRMAKTDLAVLRIAVCEIKFMEDVPKAVSVNEAVELCKKFGTEQSQRFVNGVLKNI